MRLRGSNQHQYKYALDSKTKVRIGFCLFFMATIIFVSHTSKAEAQWFYEVETPCPSRCEGVVNQPTPTPRPLSKEEIIAQSKHPAEILHIWEKETTKGKNTNPNALHNICASKGKSNEFGYGGMQKMICFDSFEESVRVVDEWLSKQTAEVLCYYNLGIKTKDCTYVK